MSSSPHDEAPKLEQSTGTIIVIYLVSYRYDNWLNYCYTIFLVFFNGGGEKKGIQKKEGLCGGISRGLARLLGRAGAQAKALLLLFSSSRFLVELTVYNRRKL